MIFGWDISTSIIGVSIFDDAGNFQSSSYCDLRKIEKNQIEKAVFFKKWLTNNFKVFIDLEVDSTHYIEDKLGGFAMGKSMQQTLLKLAAFNATISYIIWETFHQNKLGVTMEHIHPSSVKATMKQEGLIIPKGSKDKKKLTLKFVSEKEKKFVVSKNRNDNADPWCYDMADSYIVARAGFLRNAQGKKALHSEESPEESGEET